MKDFLQAIGVIPKYTEVKFFLFSLVFLLIFSTNPGIRNKYIIEIIDKDAGFIPLVVLLGIGMSFFYVFSSREMSKFSRMILLFYAAMVNFFVSMEAYQYLSNYRQGLYIILPLINAINAFIAIALIVKSTRLMIDNSIVSKQATYSEIIVGSILVFIIFFVSQYILNNYWAITFSMCLVYASNLNELINGVLVRRFFVFGDRMKM